MTPGVAETNLQDALQLPRRFREKVSVVETGCWEWIGSRHRGGYGQVWLDGRVVQAHRLSFERHVGPIPPGMLICHRCDNPPCVNPAHLFLGTMADNAADMIAKGRWKAPAIKVVSDGLAKLHEDDVPEIRRRMADGESRASIARSLGVSRRTIGRVRPDGTLARA